jgi:hypothetical protein
LDSLRVTGLTQRSESGLEPHFTLADVADQAGQRGNCKARAVGMVIRFAT